MYPLVSILFVLLWLWDAVEEKDGEGHRVLIVSAQEEGLRFS